MLRVTSPRLVSAQLLSVTVLIFYKVIFITCRMKRAAASHLPSPVARFDMTIVLANCRLESESVNLSTRVGARPVSGSQCRMAGLALMQAVQAVSRGTSRSEEGCSLRFLDR